MKKRFSRVLPDENTVFFLTFLIALVIFFYDIVAMRSFLLTGDNLVQSFSWLKVYSENIKDLNMPFWVTGISSGFPVMGEGQVGGFYPLNFLFFMVLPFKVAYNGILIAHLLIGGIFTYFFTRKVGADLWGGTLAALVFCFGSAFTNYGYHLPMIRALVWFPAVLLLFEIFFEKNKARYILLAGVIMGLQLLSGSSQMAFYSFFMYFLYFILRGISEKRRYVLLITYFGVFSGIALLVFLPQLIITIPVIKHSARISSLEFSLWGSLNPVSAMTFVFPTFFGGKAFVAVEDLFLGALTLLFLISGVRVARKNNRVMVLLAMCVISVFLSMGRFNPFYVQMLRVTRFYVFRAPSRFVFFAIFGASVISGVGFTVFFSSARVFAIRASKITLYLMALFVGVCFAIRTAMLVFRDKIMDLGQRLVDIYVAGKAYHRHGPDVYTGKVEDFYDSFLNTVSPENPFFLISIVFILISAAYMILILRYYSRQGDISLRTTGIFRKSALMLIGINLFVFSFYPPGLRHHARSYASIDSGDSDIKRILDDDDGTFRILPLGIASGELPSWATPNLNMYFGLDSAGGYSPLSSRAYMEFMGKFQAVDDSLGISCPDMSSMGKDDIIKLRLLNVKYIISNTKIDLAGVSKMIVEGGTYLYRVEDTFPRAYFSEDLNDPIIISGKFPGVVKYVPGYAEFSIDVKERCFFVFSESYFPGWRAWIDGQEVPIESFMGVMQAVKVEKGDRRVVFKYSPLYGLK